MARIGAMGRDREVDIAPELAAADAILVVDGIFLHRDELAGCWDFSAFLSVPFDVTFQRMAVRDGFPADPADPANSRYVKGQQLYLAACSPESRADLVIDNTDPANPLVVRSGPMALTRTPRRP